MRHSDIRLTMGVYTDPKLLDVRGALDALPRCRFERDRAEREAVRATGTDGCGANALHQRLHQLLTIGDKTRSIRWQCRSLVTFGTLSP